MRGDQGQQSQPYRVGQRLQQRRDLLACSMLSGWAVSGAQQAAVSAGLTTVKGIDTGLY